MNRRHCCELGLVCLLILACGAARASANVPLLTKETLINAIADETMALTGLAGDAGGTIGYTWSVNTNTGAFSYATTAGQSYHGLAFVVSASGTYSAGTNTYNWLANGTLGAFSWSESQSAAWVGDPTATINGPCTWGNGLTGTISGTVNVDGAGHSDGTVTFTPTGGVPGQYTVTDFVPLTGPWTIIWNGRSAQFAVTDNTGGILTGTALTTLPEPSGFALATIAIARITLRRRRRAIR